MAWHYSRITRHYPPRSRHHLSHVSRRDLRDEPSADTWEEASHFSVVFAQPAILVPEELEVYDQQFRAQYCTSSFKCNLKRQHVVL